ncbi:hypothetical protein LXA43DRAFT_1098360 [Ganoderma leucocontextum]|nr:hypothetical protein LXA43DRAFT_1098360 [Ganoderma leucocontextum]
MASTASSNILSSSVKPRLDRLSALAAKAKAKVGHRMPRAFTIVSRAKVSFAVVTTLGVGAAMKNNQKQCEEIAALVEELMSGLLEATHGVEEDELSDMTRWSLQVQQASAST